MNDLHLDINLVEAVWISINIFTFLITFSAWLNARADRAAVKKLNGQARELNARGLVRREVFRLIVQLGLLALAIPGVFSDRDIDPLNPFVDILILIAIVLALSSLFDAKDRKELTVMIATQLLTHQEDGFSRIEHKIDELEAHLIANGNGGSS